MSEEALLRDLEFLFHIKVYKGQIGMCYEFQTTDAMGERSSASYCYEGWWNNLITRTTLELLNKCDDKIISSELNKRMQVGSNDLIFKYENGYQGYLKGKSMLEKVKSSDIGYPLMKSIWKDYLEKRF